MAATLTGSGELTFISFPIDKTETDADGNVLVYGKASDGAIDSDEQIIDPDFAAKAIGDWLDDGANVRVQHNPQRDPAGVGVAMDVDGDGGTWVKSKIIEPIAQKLVLGGALRAYSVGIARPQIIRDARARGGLIKGGQVVEISLVDRPANKNCSIQLVKAARDGRAELSGEITGSEEFIRKAVGMTAAVAEKTVTLELPEDVSVAFTPADLAKVIGKRQSPNVGEDTHPGGVNRDELPDSDFAGRNRSFPITSPGDVSDAWQSVGRAGDDNYSTEQLQANIKRIAHEKGPEYVAALPDTAKTAEEPAVAKTGGGCQTCGNTGKIRDGHMKCPDCGGTGNINGVADRDDDANGVEKGQKETKISVTGNGDTDHDGDGLFDADGDGDGAVAHRADDDDDDDDDDDSAEKAFRPSKKCKTCRGQGQIRDGHRQCPDCGGSGERVKKSVAAAALKGAGKMMCRCGGKMKAQHQFCPSCGAPAGSTGDVPEKTGTAATEKSESPAEAAHARGHESAPMPTHREPDGAEVEAYESDAHMPDGDHEAPTQLEAPTLKSDAGARALLRIVQSGTPTNMGILHDMTCAAFSPEMIAKCYPERSLAGEIDEMEWQVKSLNLAVSLPYHEAARAAQLGQHAVTLKRAAPADAWEAHDDLHKAFSDANPGPGAAPAPSDCRPASFNRPYISAGHAAPSPAQGAPNSTPITSGEIEAAQFQRPFLRAGHAANSPGDGTPNGVPTSSAAVSKAVTDAISASNQAAAVKGGRTFYSNAGKATTRTAMQAIHDHIQHTFPDICPMRGEAPASEPDAEPETVKMPAVPRQLTKAHAPAPSEAADSAVITKSAGDEQLLVTIAELQLTVKRQGKLLKKQAKTLEAMTELPDPRLDAYRGAALTPLIHKSALTSAPAAPTMAESAERIQAMRVMEMEHLYRTTPDPAQREAAWREIIRIRGLT